MCVAETAVIFSFICLTANRWTSCSTHLPTTVDKRYNLSICIGHTKELHMVCLLAWKAAACYRMRWRELTVAQCNAAISLGSWQMRSSSVDWWPSLLKSTLKVEKTRGRKTRGLDRCHFGQVCDVTKRSVCGGNAHYVMSHVFCFSLVDSPWGAQVSSKNVLLLRKCWCIISWIQSHGKFFCCVNIDESTMDTKPWKVLLLRNYRWIYH